MSIEDEIGQAVFDTGVLRFPGDRHALVAVVMPLVKRAQAEAAAQAIKDQREVDAQIAESNGLISKRNLEPYWEGRDDAADAIASEIRKSRLTIDDCTANEGAEEPMTDKREELIRALADEAHDEDGWLSDAQRARVEWDEGNRSIRFCGEGSIDIEHLVSIATAVFEQAHTPTTPTDDERDLDAFQKIAGVLYRDKVQEVEAFQHTPTDDEREAMYDGAWRAISGRDEPWGGCAEREKVLRVAEFAAGFRRTVQGEPSDAAVKAAKEALGHSGSGVTPLMMRRALRAAAATQKGEGR